MLDASSLAYQTLVKRVDQQQQHFFAIFVFGQLAKQAVITLHSLFYRS